MGRRKNSSYTPEELLQKAKDKRRKDIENFLDYGNTDDTDFIDTLTEHETKHLLVSLVDRLRDLQANIHSINEQISNMKVRVSFDKAPYDY